MSHNDLRCSFCHKPPHSSKKLLSCSRCHQAWYHDQTCQRAHYKKKHKIQCAKWTTWKQQQDDLRQHSIQVIQDEQKGRILKTRENCQVGDVVFTETPVVAFDTTLEFRGLLKAYVEDTSPLQQSDILRLYAPDESEMKWTDARTSRYARLEEQLREIQQSDDVPANAEQVLSVTTARRLLAIVESNAHHLFNGYNNISHDNHWMGLFLTGSMMEHSCCPVTTMDTTVAGELRFLAETPLAAQQAISFSYMEGVWESTRSIRREFLREHKHFVCQCLRCQHGVDECSPIQVSTRCCDLSLHVQCPSFKDSCWICIGCRECLDKNDSRVVHALEQQEELTRRLEKFENAPGILDDILAFYQSSEYQDMLHPWHAFNVKVRSILSQVAGSMARGRSAGSDTKDMLRLSATALLQNVEWIHRVVSVWRVVGSPSGQKSDTWTSVLDVIKRQVEREDGVKINPCLSRQTTSLEMHEFVQEHLRKSMERNPFHTTSDALLLVYYAGQDLVLAGDIESALLLFRSYELWFERLQQPGPTGRAKVKLFCSSNGAKNPFGEE